MNKRQAKTLNGKKYIDMSVIEDIKGYILKQMPEYDAERECTVTLIDIKALLEFIDRKVNEVKGD